MKKNLFLISLMLGTLLMVSAIGIVSASASGGAVVSKSSAACGETTITAYQSGSHISNMYLLVYAGGQLYSENIPSNGATVSITVGPFASNEDIKWRVFGGGERDFDQPLWNGYGSPSFVSDINDYIDSNGDAWTYTADPYDENPFTTWNDVNVKGCACTVVIDEPSEGSFYDPVTVKWHYEGICKPVEYGLYYQEGTCDGDAWVGIESNLNPAGDNQNTYEWDVSNIENGSYCLLANMDQTGVPDPLPDVGGVSGVWHLDLAKPYVNMTVGNPKTGECSEGSGDCWVTPDTDVTLTCSDDHPAEAWQSGVDYIQYQIEGPSGLGSVQTVNGDTATVNFGEDSNHVLSYWCYDKVGKKSEVKTKNFFVNSEAPELDKSVGNPKVPGCSSEMEGCDWYVNQSTQFCISATKGNENHPTPGDLTISCEANRWLSDPQSKPEHVSVNLDENNCFTYNEDSYHELHCTATDALGNEGDLYEADIVDSQAPETSLEFEGPYYNNGTAQWIDSVSRVNLTAVDPQPHPVGGVTTYYRTGKIDDSYCYGNSQGELSVSNYFPGLSGEWMTYSEPFGLNESCHAIEYYSVDALGNKEPVKTEFVFSDHHAPNTTKIVGEPSIKVDRKPLENWSENPNQNIEWEITTDTPVDLSCEDQAPHPAGVGDMAYSGIWYRVVLDGQYNDSEAQWEFEQTDHLKLLIQFSNESEHLVEFKCVDNVNKTSKVDSELFKVTGEAFNLTIDDKWDLISVPFNLLSSDISDVFGNSTVVKSVWSYENGTWLVYYPGNEEDSTLHTIVPGKGYWVKSDESTSVLIGGELFSPATTPNSVEVNVGWNLIGKYGTRDMSSYCDLFSLVNGIGFPQWSALYGYDAQTQEFVPMDTYDEMSEGDGYWLGMRTGTAGTYFPSSICWN